MNEADLPFLSLADLAVLIKSKEVSPVEATEAYLERIDYLDFKFNSYLTVCREEALRTARVAEHAISRGDYLGLMHGIPVAVKDQIWSKGIRTTDGSRILADFVPDEDATVLAKLKSAGAILLGKTNLTEFAIGSEFVRKGGAERFSHCRNPWDLDMSPGASSGGSGAATAAFLCATSLGEDTGGSVRYPASWCGLVGLRPTWGRVSRYGVIPGVWSMDIVGTLSRTVQDAAMTLGAIAGYDPKDPYTWNTPVPDYTQAFSGDIRGMRVGVVTELMNGEQVEPEIKDAVVRATSVLEQLGASVDEVSIPLSEYGSVILASHCPETALNHKKWVRARLHDYGPNNRISLLIGSIMPAQAYYKAQKLRTLLTNQVHEALTAYDVLVSPTTAIPAQKIADYPVITDTPTSTPRSFLFTQAFALASVPAISVPCGFTSGSLPIGLQIAGPVGGEEIVLKVAQAYEGHTPWHTMRPLNS